MHRLILASQSPRRRQLLEEAGFEFTVDTVKVSEIIDENLNLEDALMALAQAKAMSWVNDAKPPKGQKILVLAADTVVVLDRRILGKPKNIAEAESFLTQLSAKTHSVMTALCVYEIDKCLTVKEVATTSVTFRPLTLPEIHAYIKTGEPMDKAGAYAIQGLARDFVVAWQGSWSNVVGLPMELFEEVLKKNGWSVARRPH